eukprot:4572710-Lingulodinium_polyedra.AAC.1
MDGEAASVDPGIILMNSSLIANAIGQLSWVPLEKTCGFQGAQESSWTQRQLHTPNALMNS